MCVGGGGGAEVEAYNTSRTNPNTSRTNELTLLAAAFDYFQMSRNIHIGLGVLGNMFHHRAYCLSALMMEVFFGRFFI